MAVVDTEVAVAVVASEDIAMVVGGAAVENIVEVVLMGRLFGETVVAVSREWEVAVVEREEVQLGVDEYGNEDKAVVLDNQ